jgi:hypothetical protein
MSNLPLGAILFSVLKCCRLTSNCRHQAKNWPLGVVESAAQAQRLVGMVVREGRTREIYF